MTPHPHKPGVFPSTLPVLLAITVCIVLLFFPATSRAARTINSATLNNAASVTVTPGAAISAVANVTTDGSGSASRWRSTGWRIATTTGAMTCVNHPNHDSAGTYSETFAITAPASSGSYNAYFIAYSDDGCSSGASATYTMTNGVIVDAPPMVSSINRVDPSPTALANVSWSVTFSEPVTGVDATDFLLVQAGGVSGSAITTVSGSGTTWTVTASTGSGSGTLGLNLADNDSIIDAAGNRLGGTGNGNGNFTGQIYTIDKTMPAVSSINRVNIDPTNLTSVSWTVTFSEAVTGVDATDFALIQGGGVTGSAITSVSGSGTTWTVTVSTGSGNGTLGLNLVDNDSIIDTASNPLGGVGTGNGSFTGQVYTVDRNCFSDDFSGTLAPNWLVGMQGGSYTPQITGSRLRLSDTSTVASTWATLQRIFPGAGNKITVEFDHFAYGGTGADGIAVILSNAAIPPVAGAFGGSMGYAQKGQTPVSDCTAIGGCPGFAGGWLGVALDEYGNYSTALEGRVGGFPALVPDSVAIRGSGAGMSGYRYLVGTSTLTPVIDNNGAATPPHRYRITIDHTDSVHAWVSVERDTTGGGANYSAILGCASGQTSGCTPLDVKDAGYGQDPVPANWSLSFTAASGASTNIHEFDTLRVCTSQDQLTPTLHHIRLGHDGQACTGISDPAAITVKACVNADCSALYMESVTVDLAAITNGTWSVDPVTFTGGQATISLTNSTAGTVTLGGTATSPTATSATRCFNGATETCSLTFAACIFDVIETGASAFTPIYTKLSGTPFSLDVFSLSSSTRTVNSVQIVDASSGICSTYPSLANSTTTVPSTFTANQRKPFSFTYGSAVRDARIRVTYGSPAQYSCSSDNFAIRPQSFVVTSNATQTGSTGIPIFRAGQDTFSVTATALAGYDGTPKLNASLLSSDLPYTGLFGATTFPAATMATGVATATGLTYSEVGNFRLGQYAVYDDGFTAVDATKPQPECTSDFSNALVGSRYGCMFGSIAAGPFGRFVPDHFTVVGAVANGCGTFTSMGQPFTLSRYGAASKAEIVESRNLGDAVTQNYAGAYAPGTVNFGTENADNGTNLFARLAFYSAGTYPPLSGTWTNGVYTLTGNDTSVAFKRPTATTPDATWGPFNALDLGLTVIDTDVTTSPKVFGADMNPAVSGGASFTYKKFTGSPLIMRYGRLILQNAYGPENTPLKMQLLTQYFNGTAFINNPIDTCSLYDATALTCTDPNASDTLTCADVLATGGGVGNGSTFTLSAPNKTGPLDYTLTVNPWLQYEWDNAGNDYNENPTGHATFGIYRGNDRVINWREIMR